MEVIVLGILLFSRGPAVANKRKANILFFKLAEAAAFKSSTPATVKSVCSAVDGRVINQISKERPTRLEGDIFSLVLAAFGATTFIDAGVFADVYMAISCLPSSWR